MDLTPDQIIQLQSLGINASKSTVSGSNATTNPTEDIKQPLNSPPTIGHSVNQTISSSQAKQVLSKPNNPIVPLLSLSGLTLISFGGLILFKSKETTVTSPPPTVQAVPTQVPKSIQHYLLTSQQFFTQALSSSPDQQVELVNQSLLAASAAIKEFPSDYRGYEQRGRIYQSLADSQPQLLASAISDLSSATKLNPSSPEITRTLATLYALAGDAQNTLTYLTQTISLEPTKAQNFYDLARLQTQVGLVPQALETYTRLLSIVADPAQKTQVETEKASLEKLASQNPNQKVPSLPTVPPSTPISDAPLLQANNNTGLIIAAPETSKDISITSLTDTNSLSGTATLPVNTPSISINNTNLTSSSLVYLTITKGGKNQTLQVLSKSTGSFTAGLDAPINEPVEFKWWIVN